MCARGYFSVSIFLSKLTGAQCKSGRILSPLGEVEPKRGRGGIAIRIRTKGSPKTMPIPPNRRDHFYTM